MMKILMTVVLMLVTACAKEGQISSSSTEPATCQPPFLKTNWVSTTDSESHDFTNLDFTFLYVPYSYTGSNGVACSAQMRWYMFSPSIGGASFKMEFQSDSCGATSFYIKLGCNEISLCNDTFMSCKKFREVP